MSKKLKTFAAVAVLLAGVGGGLLYWQPWKPHGPGEGFVSGNGRIEATEVAVATKLAGRVLVIGKKRRIEDCPLEQWNLQPADDGLDHFGKVRRGEDGVENHRQRVERDGRRRSER